MQDRMAAGENLRCSAQIFDEAHWLVNFTDRKADVGWDLMSDSGLQHGKCAGNERGRRANCDIA